MMPHPAFPDPFANATEDITDLDPDPFGAAAADGAGEEEDPFAHPENDPFDEPGGEGEHGLLLLSCVRRYMPRYENGDKW